MKVNQEEQNIILGVDPGTRVTGFGLIRVDSRRVCAAVDYGCIRPPATKPLSKRYCIIYQSLVELIQQYHPTALAVETQYIHKNPQSGIKLGMARGLVILVAALYEIPIFEYTPARVKRAVTRNGRADKLHVSIVVQHLLCLSTPPKPEDAADALAVAICHGQTCGSKRCIPI